MDKLASVDRRNGEYVVTSYTQTPPGFWQMNGHFVRVAADTNSEDLGQAALAALDASNRVSLEGIDGSDPFAPVLAALGLRSYAHYMKGAASVSLEVGSDGALRITPMRNRGAREGFEEITDSSRVVSERTAGVVGRTVEAAMTQAQG